MSQIETRVVDSMDYDDVCDVIKWLREVVGIQVTITEDPPEDVPGFLFWINHPWGGEVPSIAISSGDQIFWNPSIRRLEIITPRKRSSYVIPAPPGVQDQVGEDDLIDSMPAIEDARMAIEQWVAEDHECRSYTIDVSCECPSFDPDTEESWNYLVTMTEALDIAPLQGMVLTDGSKMNHPFLPVFEISANAYSMDEAMWAVLLAYRVAKQALDNTKS